MPAAPEGKDVLVEPRVLSVPFAVSHRGGGGEMPAASEGKDVLPVPGLAETVDFAFQCVLPPIWC